MRIIAGSARGIRIEAPKGRRVRPTLDRVREALFSILMPRIEGARFLDLFAGTGANGIEALSRGASFTVFVDNDPQSLAIVGQNLERVPALRSDAEVVNAALPMALPRVARGFDPFDIVFADPPHAYDDFDALLAGIRAVGLLNDDGLVVVEHGAKVELSEEYGGFSCTRTAIYGDSALSFFS
ncbi:MAG: 16S rRNA (guanine(966)-N(2))-methyltransferase RsmD [bacterium]|nr:16S rRNA (guanine(966)-N(2))-methyltransferase RsmD [bacterium]